jgi:drug/metabolite transporter (DMT)-like permease
MWVQCQATAALPAAAEDERKYFGPRTEVQVSEDTKAFAELCPCLSATPRSQRMLGMVALAFSSACFAFAASAAKVGSVESSAPMSLFFVALVAFVMDIVAILLVQGAPLSELAGPASARRALALHTLFGTLALGLILWAIKRLCLAEAYALALTAPVFVVLIFWARSGDVVWWRELPRAGRHTYYIQILMIPVCTAGALCVARAGATHVAGDILGTSFDLDLSMDHTRRNLAAMAALGSAAASAAARASLHSMGTEVPAPVVSAWLLAGALTAAPLVGLTFRATTLPVTPLGWLAVLTCGFVLFVGQMFRAWGLRTIASQSESLGKGSAPSAFVAQADLLLVVLLDYFALRENLQIETLVGAALIAAGGGLIVCLDRGSFDQTGHEWGAEKFPPASVSRLQQGERALAASAPTPGPMGRWSPASIAPFDRRMTDRSTRSVPSLWNRPAQSSLEAPPAARGQRFRRSGEDERMLRSIGTPAPPEAWTPCQDMVAPAPLPLLRCAWTPQQTTSVQDGEGLGGGQGEISVVGKSHLDGGDEACAGYSQPHDDGRTGQECTPNCANSAVVSEHRVRSIQSNVACREDANAYGDGAACYHSSMDVAVGQWSPRSTASWAPSAGSVRSARSAQTAYF